MRKREIAGPAVTAGLAARVPGVSSPFCAVLCYLTVFHASVRNTKITHQLVNKGHLPAKWSFHCEAKLSFLSSRLHPGPRPSLFLWSRHVAHPRRHGRGLVSRGVLASLDQNCSVLPLPQNPFGSLVGHAPVVVVSTLAGTRPARLAGCGAVGLWP